MENSRFARKCNKDGGYFKCCVTLWWPGPYEEARNQLIKDGLIKDDPTRICDRKATKDPCYFCSANAMCTIQDPLNGTITNSFYPGMKKRTKSEHEIIQDSQMKKITSRTTGARGYEFELFRSIFNYIEQFCLSLLSILLYLHLAWSILEYLGLSRCILVYLH